MQINWLAKNREAGFGPASNRLAETFSLIKLLSSPQQLIAVGEHFIHKFNFVNPRNLAFRLQHCRNPFSQVAVTHIAPDRGFIRGDHHREHP